MKWAPKIIDVDYLAFYQPGSTSEDHQPKIEYFAAVQGYELTTRSELIRDEPDHPHASDEYYKLQIGTLQRLNNPLLAEKWKRITFLYTIGSIFNNARIINDLVIRSDEREILWKSLRERSQAGYLRKDPITQNSLSDDLLFILLMELSTDGSSFDLNEL
jgi:hypothetical protein